MQRLPILVFILVGSLMTAFAQENARDTSTITFGVGGAWALGGYSPMMMSGGPVFNGSYEFRILKHVALETGVHTTLPGITQYDPILTNTITTFPSGVSLVNTTISTLVTQGSARNTTVPFGARFILPLRREDVELFAGGGGAHTWNSLHYQEWGAEASLGVRFALDKHRHFWLGTSGEYLHESGDYSQNWISWTADLGYRFGGK